MKVKCIGTTMGDHIPPGIDWRSIPSADENMLHNLTIDKEYTVYGISTIKKYSWYLICEDHFDGKYTIYPMYVFHRYFVITDGRLSRYWVAVDSTDHFDSDQRIIEFGFKEWVTEEFFYSKLVDDAKREADIFLKYKELMDSEFR
ncbi:MAG: hypothetical protein Q8927_08605 [Bacteroidota bacterium]|nr:hypothetical protein [Bacteroidota bacterium]MDP4245494.1 hypothetical protein [Bacteroidota bacterium]MDP4253697.1 hypothetical protein [Bacteroidota bacterium]MDP4259981.1 hypothetical protein [Bacteroidota bacterium]